LPIISNNSAFHFLGGDKDKPGIRAAYGEQKYVRLVEFKRKYGPTSRIIFFS